METIRNYLESMFANLPNTPEVQRAKSELWQMMEDKYNELLAEGISENEAVGTVISEFGNLDELAETLGIENAMKEEVPYQGRVLRQDEVEGYVRARRKNSICNALGVFFCIISPVTFLIANVVSLYTGSGVVGSSGLGLATAFFFILLAAAISLFVFSGVRMGSWKYMTKENVCIDYATAETIHNAREKERTGHAILKTVGVLLCVFCFVPVAVMGAVGASEQVMMIGAILLFLLVGAGVFLLVASSGREDAYRTLLRFNDPQTVSGNYVPSQTEISYSNKTVEQIMSVYMQVVLCIYLIWSFLTFDWHITWIIWPVAAIVRHIINNIWGQKKEQAA